MIYLAQFRYKCIVYNRYENGKILLLQNKPVFVYNNEPILVIKPTSLNFDQGFICMNKKAELFWLPKIYLDSSVYLKVE